MQQLLRAFESEFRSVAIWLITALAGGARIDQEGSSSASQCLRRASEIDQSPLLASRLSFLICRVMRNDSLIALIDQAMVSGANFLTSIVIGRACSREQYGLYSLGLSIVFFAQHIQNSLISIPYTFYVPRISKEKLKYYDSNTLAGQISLTLLISLLIAIGGFIARYSRLGSTGLDGVFFALAIAISMILFRQFERRLFFARLQIRKALIVDMIVSSTQICGLLLLFYFHRLSAFSAYLAIGLACFPLTIIWLVHSWGSFKINLCMLPSDINSHWQLGKWVMASGLIFILANHSYLWLISFYYGIETTGIYSVCLAIVLLANPFILGISNILDPKVAYAFGKDGIHGVRRIVVKYSWILGLSIGLFSLVIFFIGGWAMKLLYGPKYAGYGDIVAVLNLSNLAIVMMVPLGSGLLAIGRSKIYSISSLAALIVTLVFGFWLVAWLKLMGAAIGLTAAMTTSLIIRWSALRKEINKMSEEGLEH
jgi:O-antigen/teichoic acid export membrane protein